MLKKLMIKKLKDAGDIHEIEPLLLIYEGLPQVIESPKIPVETEVESQGNVALITGEVENAPEVLIVGSRLHGAPEDHIIHGTGTDDLGHAHPTDAVLGQNLVIHHYLWVLAQDQTHRSQDDDPDHGPQDTEGLPLLGEDTLIHTDLGGIDLPLMEDIGPDPEAGDLVLHGIAGQGHQIHKLAGLDLDPDPHPRP